MSKLLSILGRAILIGLAFCWLLWTALTLLYSNLQPERLRQGLMLGYLIWLGLAFFRIKPKARGVKLALLSGLIVSVLYLSVRPSNEREWQPDCAVAATTDVEGDIVTIHGVRNFRYRSNTDFDEVWEDRQYDLSKLRTLDLFMSFWGPVAYCHTILSFGFEGGEQLATSIEVRKEEGETFSTYGGLFKMFELSYIFADERDLIGVRTSQRNEDVYLYRLRAEPERLKELFLSYANFADGLSREPEFYGVLTNSCGVNILHRIAETGAVHWSAKEALLNGYWGESLYERGAIDGSLPFEELREISHINQAAEADGLSSDFSARIRVGLPSAPVFSSPNGVSRETK